MLYLKYRLTGESVHKNIKHLVIDEMQDYSPIQYAVLNLLFQCPKTILGDFSQSINPNCPYSLEALHQFYEGSTLMRLEKSYRSTWEIIHFAKRLVRQADFEAVERHGAPRTTLAVEWVREGFPLPAQRRGTPISLQHLEQQMGRLEPAVFYDRGLCAHYYTYMAAGGQAHFVLYDTSQSIHEKVQLAREMHLGAVLLPGPEVEGCLDQVLA